MEQPENDKLIQKDLGMKYCGDSEDFYRDMIELYCKSYEVNCDKIEEAVDLEDWNNYIIYLHALKTTSLNVGGVMISEAAKKLEYASKEINKGINVEENTLYIKEHNNEAMVLYKKTVEKFQNMLKE